NRVWSPDLKPEDFDLVRTAIEHSNFPKLKMEARRDLLDLMARVKSPKTVPYLVNFAQRYPDSLRYRMAVIEELSSLQTRESYDQVLRLMLEQPMQRNAYGSNIFSQINDSLQLAVTLFPDLLRLADIPDMQDPLFDLLYELNRDGLIKPRDYASQKKRLLLSTQYLLNRFRQGYESDLEDGDEDETYTYASNNFSNDLKRNLALLAPFAKKDKDVQALMQRTTHLGNDLLRLYVYGLYLKQDMPVAASVLQPFAQRRETLAATYSTLAAADKLAAYPASWFADTTLLLQSAFFGKGSRNMDSVRFISRHSTRLRSAPAWLYFFDVKRKKDKEWGLAYAYVPKSLTFLKGMQEERIVNNNDYNPRDRYRYRVQPEVQVRYQVSEKKKEEIMKKKIGAIRFENRRRYSASRDDGEMYMPPSFGE
ncbi:MAG TPA: hypothetical protein PK971_15765, partial [Saprospiraceae bacterium]|nr:hypothetical protein [Saprospiraceae bacterium]